MSKVLVTGLGVGTDFGLCGSCDLDFSWLIREPATLIWAEKIIITKGAWEAQIRNETDKLDKAINTILHIAKDNNLIEIIDVKEIFTDSVSKDIISKTDYDVGNIITNFPHNIEKREEGIPGEILINGLSYCKPYIASIYASMELAETLTANCLFSKRDYEYLKFKYGIGDRGITKADSMAALNELFNIYIPNELVLHNFAFIPDEDCNNCTKINMCKDSYLNEIETNLYKIIEWRQYDEIFRAREELQKIINMRTQFGNQVDLREIQREFREKQVKVNRNIKKVFPIVKRWTNLTTVVATPLSIYSAAIGNTNATLMASGALGVAKTTDEIIKYYENKNRWVGFINKSIS